MRNDSPSDSPKRFWHAPTAPDEIEFNYPQYAQADIGSAFVATAAAQY